MPIAPRREALVGPAVPATPAPPAAPPQPFTPIRTDRAKAGPSRASASIRPPRPKRGGHAWPKLDVVGAAALGLVSAAASVALPPSALRMALVLPMLLFVPGYLLLQAFVVPAAHGTARGWQALASLGISPAVLGLLALLTSVVEGGFRLDAILVVTTLGCLAFAGAALVRRRALAHAATAPKLAESPQAATAKTGPARP